MTSHLHELKAMLFAAHMRGKSINSSHSTAICISKKQMKIEDPPRAFMIIYMVPVPELVI